jgi:5'(3')-deoxyribonucleotidase
MRLGIDLDGVVADFTSGWMRLYNEEFGTGLRSDQVVRWGGMLDLTHFETTSEFWRWARRGDGPSIFRYFDTYDGAKPWLTELAREHRIVILTAKPWWAVHDTLAWIAEHRIPTREVHVRSHKWHVECDVYLEDNPVELRGMVHNRPDATTCRFVRPWNEPVGGAVDVHSWDDFGALVHRFDEDATLDRR